MENLKSPRGYFLFSTWASFISSEVSFDSSEVSFDSSEEFFILHVGISKSPRGNHFSPTQHRIDMPLTLNYCCDPTFARRASVVEPQDDSCRDARSVRPLSNDFDAVTFDGDGRPPTRHTHAPLLGATRLF